ncbi:hypothetical protein [Luteibacter sp. CQ10]|uniref:hypothetical protein n=1 Tax=Luteibacter sp. CQ10 TaxID=2805821 RepID=UPI0034A3EC52
MITSSHMPAPLLSPVAHSLPDDGAANGLARAESHPSILDTLYRDMVSSRVDAKDWLDLMAAGGEGMTPGRLIVATYKLGSMGVKMAAVTTIASSAKNCLNELKQNG